MSAVDVMGMIEADLAACRRAGDQARAAHLADMRDAVETLLYEARRCCAGVGELSELRAAVEIAGGNK